MQPQSYAKLNLLRGSMLKYNFTWLIIYTTNSNGEHDLLWNWDYKLLWTWSWKADFFPRHSLSLSYLAKIFIYRRLCFQPWLLVLSGLPVLPDHLELWSFFMFHRYIWSIWCAIVLIWDILCVPCAHYRRGVLASPISHGVTICSSVGGC